MRARSCTRACASSRHDAARPNVRADRVHARTNRRSRACSSAIDGVDADEHRADARSTSNAPSTQVAIVGDCSRAWTSSSSSRRVRGSSSTVTSYRRASSTQQHRAPRRRATDGCASQAHRASTAGSPRARRRAAAARAPRTTRSCSAASAPQEHGRRRRAAGRRHAIGRRGRGRSRVAGRDAVASFVVGHGAGDVGSRVGSISVDVDLMSAVDVDCRPTVRVDVDAFEDARRSAAGRRSNSQHRWRRPARCCRASDSCSSSSCRSRRRRAPSTRPTVRFEPRERGARSAASRAPRRRRA